MLKHGEVNPLNIHGLRELSWCPPHFEQVKFEAYVDKSQVSHWIYEFLSGRFYIGPTDDNNKRQILVGFESPGEASYFSLCLSQINPEDHF
jgi:hypothetical protein